MLMTERLRVYIIPTQELGLVSQVPILVGMDLKLDVGLGYESAGVLQDDIPCHKWSLPLLVPSCHPLPAL